MSLLCLIVRILLKQEAVEVCCYCSYNQRLNLSTLTSLGKVPLSTWIKDVAIPIQMWRLCVGLIQFEMRCFQFNDEGTIITCYI